jgi:hypothetical protein
VLKTGTLRQQKPMQHLAHALDAEEILVSWQFHGNFMAVSWQFGGVFPFFGTWKSHGKAHFLKSHAVAGHESGRCLGGPEIL